MALTGGPLVTNSAGGGAAGKFRQFLHAMWPLGGVTGPTDCQVKQRVSAGQGVLVSAGGIFLPGNSSTIQGDYFDFNDADLDVPASAADGAQTRIDRVIYRVRDPDFVAGTPLNTFEWLTGTAGAGVPPTVPGDAVSVAQVARAVNGNTLTNANITDERVFAWQVLQPGSRGFHVRNSANTRDNINLADSGLLTLANTIAMPTSAGGTIAPTGYGSLGIKHDEQSPSGVPSVTINLPAGGFRDAVIRVYGRSALTATTDPVSVRFNSDSGANYTWSATTGAGDTPPTGASLIAAGNLPAANAPANLAGQIWIEIPEFLNTSFVRTLLARVGYHGGGAVHQLGLFQGNWTSTAALTSVTVFLSNNFVAGSRIITYVIP